MPGDTAFFAGAWAAGAAFFLAGAFAAGAPGALTAGAFGAEAVGGFGADAVGGFGATGGLAAGGAGGAPSGLAFNVILTVSFFRGTVVVLSALGGVGGFGGFGVSSLIPKSWLGIWARRPADLAFRRLRCQRFLFYPSPKLPGTASHGRCLHG